MVTALMLLLRLLFRTEWQVAVCALSLYTRRLHDIIVR